MTSFRPQSALAACRLASVLALCLLASSSAPAVAGIADIPTTERSLGSNAPAYRALQEGRVDEAASLLKATVAAHPDNATAATAHQLLCRVYYAQNDADPAIHECELAVAAAPSVSDNYLWLGRAYGLKARHAGPISGFQLARKVQANFARAVELNPQSIPALNDLGEYDLSAPAIVGGGVEKAEALAQRMMAINPGQAHRMLALIARENKDYDTAEAEFKVAISLQKSAEAWVDLAHFYQTRERPDDAAAAARSAVAADRAHDAALVDVASILTAAHRDPDLAEQALRLYLASPAKSDAAPAFKVHLQLSKLLAKRGDKASADNEVEAAQALAASFAKNYRSSQGS